MNRNTISKAIQYSITLVMVALMAFLLCFVAIASDSKTEVAGKLYEFAKDSHYKFSNSDEYSNTGDTNTYGNFSISGNIVASSTENGVPSYEVSDGKLLFYYNYGDSLLLNANTDSWHLVEDKSKDLNDIKLDSDILNGAIVLQTSKDKLNWTNVLSMTNVFGETPVRTESIYESKDVQLINGCYYRLIVAYELRIRTKDSNILFINTDKYEHKKCTEVYELYAFTDSGDDHVNASEETYSLGSRARVEDFDSYSGEIVVDKDDIHYGWDLGEFFVSGYTNNTKDSNGNMVFLKNVGDKVTLWFHLNKDINNIDGTGKLSVTADNAGSDQYFETPIMDFGRGVLIVRHTDHNNVKSKPQYYVNYLEANASLGADTKVQLFEEGDYEIALDYQVTDNRLIDKIGHYRIFFKFSIRNGNCMVYLFDVSTGSELTNSALTQNGFRLDLANSKYLNVNIKREIMAESADGLIEDTRFNAPARDGAEYTDEGIYTITVSNEYTGQFTVKRIYVGSNNVLRAHMTTGLSISEINDLVKNGATISDDGTIKLASIVTSTTDPTRESTNPPENVVSENTPPAEIPSDLLPNDESQSSFPVLIIVIAVIGAVAIIVALIIISKKKKTIRTTQSNFEEAEDLEAIK